MAGGFFFRELRPVHQPVISFYKERAWKTTRFIERSETVTARHKKSAAQKTPHYGVSCSSREPGEIEDAKLRCRPASPVAKDVPGVPLILREESRLVARRGIPSMWDRKNVGAGGAGKKAGSPLPPADREGRF